MIDEVQLNIPKFRNYKEAIEGIIADRDILQLTGKQKSMLEGILLKITKEADTYEMQELSVH